MPVNVYEQMMRAHGLVAPEDHQQALADYEKGRDLKAMKAMPGWQHVLDIMEAHVVEAEAKLLDSDDTDLQKLLALQKEAKAARKFFHEVQAIVESYIQETHEPSDAVNQHEETLQ